MQSALRLLRFVPFVLALLLLQFAVSPSQTFTITGLVRDGSTRESLVAANVRIDGTTRGTISNADGIFRLSLLPDHYTIIVSFIGYRADTLLINLDRDLRYDVILVPVAISLSEIVVTDEDPAYRIMRKVIESKKQWQEHLRSYQFEAFTRQVLYRDTSIASIMESYTTGFWQQGDTLREIVRQKRQTENVPFSGNFATVGGIVNFYDDEIRFSGFTFVGPTSPEAFEYYLFKLEGTRKVGEAEFYTIRMTPDSRLTPLFAGTVTVAGDSYSLVGIDVKPNESYRIPFVSELNVSYAQQFTLIDTSFWMPADIRLRGSAEIGLMGFSFPKIGFDQVSAIYEYRINALIPDSLSGKSRRIAAPDAEVYDSAYWAQTEVLPLTNEQQDAYEELDSTQSLDKQFRPSGPLMALDAVGNGVFQYADLRFNRAEGLFAGVDVDFDSAAQNLRLWARAGYGLSDKRAKWGVGAEWYFDHRRHWSAGLEAFSDIDHFPDGGFYETFFVTFSSLMYKTDQRDYFYRRGGRVFLTGHLASQLRLTLSYVNEQHWVAKQRTDFSFFFRSSSYRPHPIAQNGSLRSIRIDGRLGQDPVVFGLVSRNFLDASVEHAMPSALGSDFSFTRISVVGEATFPAFLTRNLFPPALTARVSAGASRGVLPPQRIFTLEGRSVVYGPFGLLKGARLMEFAGDTFVALSIEQNFRSIPFLALDIPFLYENSLEVVLHGSVAHSTVRPGTSLPYGNPTPGWYSEAGVGLSRLFGLLRVDLTHRFTEPGGFFVTFAAARIF